MPILLSPCCRVISPVGVRVDEGVADPFVPKSWLVDVDAILASAATSDLSPESLGFSLFSSVVLCLTVSGEPFSAAAGSFIPASFAPLSSDFTSTLACFTAMLSTLSGLSDRLSKKYRTLGRTYPDDGLLG